MSNEREGGREFVQSEGGREKVCPIRGRVGESVTNQREGRREFGQSQGG